MILVTGGLGFVGSNLCQRLLGKGKKVRILDDMSSNAVPIVKGAEIVYGDICSPENNIWRKIDTVVHLAAMPGVATCTKNPKRALSVNLFGTLVMLEEAVKHGVSQFILASSVGAVLGEQIQPANEEQIPNPQSLYGWSKKAAEEISLQYKNDMKVCVLRFTNIYGENCHHKESVIAKLIMRQLGEKFTIYGDGHQTRDFIYVGDVCSAIIKAIEKESTGTYHIGSGFGLSLLDLIDYVRLATGGMPHVAFKPNRPGDVRDNYANIEKAKSGLGWEPETGIMEGLRKTWEWGLTNSNKVV